MAHELLIQTISRIGGMVLLFGLLWLGLAIPTEHEFNSTAVQTGTLLEVALGIIMLGIGFGGIGLPITG